MNYNEIKKLCSLKKIAVKNLAEKIEMTETGLYSAFRNNTLKIRDLEQIAKVLGVTVDYFFDEKDDQKNININGNMQVGNKKSNINDNANNELETCKKELALTKEILKGKDEIIELLKGKK